MHAAHVFAPGQIQENIPGELFIYLGSGRAPNSTETQKELK